MRECGNVACGIQTEHQANKKASLDIWGWGKRFGFATFAWSYGEGGRETVPFSKNSYWAVVVARERASRDTPHRPANETPPNSQGARSPLPISSSFPLFSVLAFPNSSPILIQPFTSVSLSLPDCRCARV